MSIVRRPQPPGDTGSRNNLINRKGKINTVEHAYAGIVNVYALIPPDPDDKKNPLGKPIKLEDFSHGILSIPIGSSLYSGSSTGGRKKQSFEGPIKYKWGTNKHLSRDGLYRFDGDKIHGSDITTESKNLATNIRYYEAALDSDPSLVSTPTQDEIYNAVKYINSIKHPVGSYGYDKAVFEHAIRLHIYPGQMNKFALARLPIYLKGHRTKQIEVDIKYLMENGKSESDVRNYLKKEYGFDDVKTDEVIKRYNTKYMRTSLEKTKAEKDQEVANAAAEVKELQKSQKQIPQQVITIDTDKLPRSLSDTSGPIDQDHREDYQKLSPEQILAVPKSNIYYEHLNNGATLYYVKMPKDIERRKKLKRVRAKRVIAYRIKKNKKINIKRKLSNSKTSKCSRSSKMKKSILKNIRCRCRRKK